MMPEKDTAAVSFCKSELRVLPKTLLSPSKPSFRQKNTPQPILPTFQTKKSRQKTLCFPAVH